MLRQLRKLFPQNDVSRAMWKNFASSILMLAIALMSALYSSSAGREGRVWEAGISALIALIIAIWVGVRFVPRLARGVDWDWLPLHYKVTREGWIYFGAVLIVVFAAINTNNNLLYMVLSAMLAVLLLSGFLSSLNFRDLKATVRIPPFCYAREPFPLSVQLRNEKRMFPSLSLTITPETDGPFRFARFYVQIVRPQGEKFHYGQGMLARRGRYSLERIKANTRYPFGFFLKARAFPVDAECVCYPEIIPREEMDFSVLDIQGVSPRFERGLGYDLYTIRDYVPSDSARHVHWKASAKTATLKTREYAAEDSRRVVLLFDRFGNPGDSAEFEKLVSRAASLAVHLMRDGIEVALMSDQWQTGFGTSETLQESILEFLALVKMEDNAERPWFDSNDGSVVLSLR